MTRGQNAVEELRRLSSQLEAIANWQDDHVGTGTQTGKLLRDSANWLSKTALHTCGQGYIGCRGGATCSSDHK